MAGTLARRQMELWALLPGKRFVILDFKRRSGWSLEKHLALIQFKSVLGGAYITAGEKARLPGC